MIYAWALSLCSLTAGSAEIEGATRSEVRLVSPDPPVLLELGSNLTWRGRWQQRVREGGSELPDLSNIEKDSPFGTGPGRKVTCVGTSGIALPTGFTEGSLQPLVPAKSINEVWAYSDAGRYGTNVQGMRFAAIALGKGEDNNGKHQIAFGTGVPSAAPVWNEADCDFGTALKSGARADAAAKLAESNATWEGTTWRIYRQVTCVGTWGTHIPWGFTAPSVTPDPLPKTLHEIWESNVAGDFGSNVKGMQYAIVSLMDGQKNGGKYRVLFSNAMPPESENLWDDEDCAFGTKALQMGASPAALPRKSGETETAFGGTTWRFYKREASCEAKVATIAPGNTVCETNNWYGGWRRSKDCTPQITAQSDLTTWNNGYGVHFTEWAKITLSQPAKVSEVEIFHWPGLQCPYELQYDSGDGRWVKACNMAGTIAGKETCSSGFPVAPLGAVRIWKAPQSRCPDAWFRLTGVRVTGAQCQAWARCSQPYVAKAAWTASGSGNRDGGLRGDVNNAINDKYYYVRYRTGADKKFAITLTLREAATVAAVGISVGNSPDCTGEGYSGLRVDVLASGSWKMVYDKQQMFGNYERGAQFVAKAKGFALDKPFFHSFESVSGVTVVRLTLGWADICYQSSISLNNIQVVGMPCELQGTTATTTEAFRWGHINPVLAPDWQERKSLSRPGSFHGWQAGAFSASEITAKSAKRGVRFKATPDATIMVGLSHGNSNDIYWDIDYSFYVYASGNRLWARTGPRGWWGNANLGTRRWRGGDDDIFEVRLNSDRSRVEYLVNRRVLWTAPESVWFPLNIDTSFYRGGAYDVSWVCDGGCSEEPGYTKVFLATDAKRWGRGPGGPSGSDRPNGEGYTSGEYAVFMRQSLDGCKLLCNERYWCAGFGFKHTDSFGNMPDWQEGTCQLMSRLIETTSRVNNFDSYKKVGTWRSYGQNSACRIDDKDRSEDGVKTVERLRNVATLQDCKVICQNKATCTGIEYGQAYSRGDVYCELWSTEIRTSAGMPGVECLVYDNKKGLFERQPSRGCGYGGKCGRNNNLFIGWNGHYYSDKVTRDTALEVCGAVCESSESCGGFNYHEKNKRCYYRKSVTCGSVRNTDRDCYVRRAEVPSDEQETKPPPFEVFYNGCYRNQGRNRNNGRERGHFSIPECVAKAKKGGFLYFGMEYPQGTRTPGKAECMLLDDIPRMDTAIDRDCQVETWNKLGLGGGSRLAVYSTIKVCHSGKQTAPHNANFRCQTNDRWGGWRRSNDCSPQITSQSDTWTWNHGYGVHFTTWAEIKLPYAMQLESFDVYHWWGTNCWYNIEYDQGGTWRRACRVRGSRMGRDICRNRFPKTGLQRIRLIKSSHQRCPDRWFRLTGVDAEGHSCQACSRQLLDVEESQRSYNNVFGNNKKGTGHAQSRLNSPQAWSPKSRSANQWMTMDLQAKYFVAGVVTRGRANYDQWVTSFVVQYSNNNRNFFNAPGGEGANYDRHTQQQVLFLRPVSARYIRILVKRWHGWPSLRAAVLVCNSLMPVAERGGRLVTSLSSSCTGYDMNRYSGDDGGLLWFNGNFVYYEGDGRIVRSVAGGGLSLQHNFGWNWHLESVHADPVSGQIYRLLNNRGRALNSYHNFQYIDCLSSGLGRQSRATLSQSFQIHWYRVFIGDGEMVVLDRQSQWRIIKLGCSGTLEVKVLASMSSFWMRGCERGRQGGILENDGKSYWIIVAANSVYRRAISGPARNQVIRLSSSLGDICSLSLDYKRNRWYYHREGGRFAEGVYSCPATYAASLSEADDGLYDIVPDSGGTGLYALPMPRHVYSNYLRWRPAFRINNFQSECPGGWRQYRQNCYRYMGWANFRGAEQHCNVYQAHIFMPESDAEYDWVEANIVRVSSWHWLGVIGSTSGTWTEDVTNMNRLDGKDPFQVSSRLTAKPSPHHLIDHRHVPCYIYHTRHGYWRYHWHRQHCHEGRYFICKMPLKVQPPAWFYLAQTGYTCGKTSYRDLGSDMTISGCYAASRNDANCNGQGFHYYTLRSGKFGQCFCGTAADVRDDGKCWSNSIVSTSNNADFNHIYKYKFFEYHLAGNNYCMAKNDRRAEGSENPAKTLGACQAACSSDGYCFGFEFYANSIHEGSKCWLFTGHKRDGNVIPVRAFFGGRYKDATCYIKAPYFEDGCYNDYGIPGYKFSHLGYWAHTVRTSNGDASLAACARACDRASYACIGFHVYEDGNVRHCYTYTQERSFHSTINDARNKAFVRCKSPTWHPNDQGVGWKRFSDECQASGLRLCSYKELCPAGKGREPVGGRQAQTDAWCPIVDNNVANYVRCGNVGAACQKLTEYGALAKQNWPLANNRPDLKDAYACCDA